MLSYIFGNQKDPNEIKVNEICTKILSHDSTVKLSDLFQELRKNYVPNYTYSILSKISNKLISILMTAPDDLEIQMMAIKLLKTMAKKSDDSIPNSNPVDVLCLNPDFPKAMFLLAHPYNKRIIYLIRFFFIGSPNTFIQFAINSTNSLKPMIDTIIEQQDSDAGQLLVQIVTAKKELCNAMFIYIKPIFKQLPVSTVFDFMNYSKNQPVNQFRELIPDNAILKWLNENTEFSLFDIESMMEFYPFIWENPISAHYMNLTVPNQTKDQLSWFRKMKPQTFNLPIEETLQAAERFTVKPEILMSVVENYGRHEKVTPNSYQTFIFIRLYLLSLALPSDVPENAIPQIYRFLFDPDEWISAAAAQLLFIWIAKFSYKVPPGIVYRVASSLYMPSKSGTYYSLLKSLLKILSNQYNKIVSLLSTEPKLKYSKEVDDNKLKYAPWRFPNFLPLLNSIDNIQYEDFQTSLTALGYLVDFLGLNEVENEQL